MPAPDSTPQAPRPEDPIAQREETASEPDPSRKPSPLLHAAEGTGPSTAEADEPEPDAWLRISDQWVIALVCLLLLGWSGFHWLERSRWGRQEVEIERQPAQHYVYMLDLNTANWIELALLEGIGEVLGKKIVADREANGPFQTVDALRRVNGIGPKTLEKLKPHLTVGNSGAAQQKAP
ncbi:MAG: helix-hairpin-helix domain-containing protein [Planctomycetaceae bacterium]|nr:helix-hairpin-helix domain-containing protein [Planctomycetaceae bacterium]